MSSAMPESPDSLFTRIDRWRDVAELAPRLVLAGAREWLGAAASIASVLWREGPAALHWKVMGDALAGLLRSSGPGLVKLGQILATRGDLLPAPLCARLETLYAGQAPMSGRALRRALEGAFGARLPFRHFDPEPFAVGSMAQIHRACLRSGTRVVVKLIRPGVERGARRDLNALRAVLDLMLSLFARGDSGLRRLALRALADLEEGLRLETDLEHEADVIEEFRRRLARSPRVYVPACHRALSSRGALVLEELRGRPLSQVRGGDAETARRTAQLALREILTQVFDEGRFHADPHAGNLLLLDDGRLGLVDLGLTGELRVEDRRCITRAVRAFLSGDADGAIRALLALGSVAPDFDLEAFKRDVLAAVRSTSANDARRLEARVNQLLWIAARHRVHLPSSTIRLVKALVTIEGVARSLDPEIDVWTTALPVVLRSLTPRLLRWRYWRDRLTHSD
jgi:ubiquinone biosynthesis protein